MKTTLRHIANIQTGLFAKPESKGEVAHLQAKHFDENGRLISTLYPDLKADNINEKHLLRDGDVLFAAKGSKNFAVVFKKYKLPATASTSFFVLRLSDKSIIPAFLAWFLNHPKTQTYLKTKARGTGIPSIRKSVLEDLEIIIPSTEQQKIIIRIAELSSKEFDLTAKIQNHRKQLIQQQIINAIK